MVAEKQGIPRGVEAFLARIDKEVYLRRAVARSLGTSVGTLKQAEQDDPSLGPTYLTYYNSKPLYLYTPADIAALRVWAAKKWPHGRVGQWGRAVMWSEEEQRDRQHRQCQARYMHVKSLANARAGLHEVAADYQRRSDLLRTQLRAEWKERNAYMTRPQVHPA